MREGNGFSSEEVALALCEKDGLPLQATVANKCKEDVVRSMMRRRMITTASRRKQS